MKVAGSDGVIVAFSVFNLYTSPESLKRMKALQDKDVVKIALLTLIAGALFITTIFCADM